MAPVYQRRHLLIFFLWKKVLGRGRAVFVQPPLQEDMAEGHHCLLPLWEVLGGLSFAPLSHYSSL